MTGSETIRHAARELAAEFPPVVKVRLADEERAATVAWLRAEAERFDSFGATIGATSFRLAAYSIETVQHLQGERPCKA